MYKRQIYNHQAPRTQNGFGRGQRCIEGVIRGLCRRHTGQNRFRVGSVRGTKLNAQTHGYTGEVKIVLMRQGRGSEATEAVFCLQAKKPLHSGSYEHTLGAKKDTVAVAKTSDS